MSALLRVRRLIRPHTTTPHSSLEMEVVEPTPAGALVVGPKGAIPTGMVCSFSSGPHRGWFVVDCTYDHVDPDRSYHSVRAVGPDALIRPAGPWFVGARWQVHATSRSDSELLTGWPEAV